MQKGNIYKALSVVLKQIPHRMATNYPVRQTKSHKIDIMQSRKEREREERLRCGLKVTWSRFKAARSMHPLPLLFGYVRDE